MKWFCRSIDAPKPETIINLAHSLRCWLTGATVPWLEEWQEWQKELQAEAAEEPMSTADCSGPRTDMGYSSWGLHQGDTTVNDHVEGGSLGTSSGSTKRSAMALRRSKRMLTAFGLGGIYVTWTLFAWFIFTYGSLIYQLLGPAQQNDFARGWGVSYGALCFAATPSCAAWKVLVAQLLRIARRRHGRGGGVARYSEGGGEGHDHPCHPGAPAPHAPSQLAGGARCVSIAARPPVAARACLR